MSNYMKAHIKTIATFGALVLFIMLCVRFPPVFLMIIAIGLVGTAYMMVHSMFADFGDKH